VDKLKKSRDQKIEEILLEILPEAFAVVKETGRRFSENENIVSIATELDKEFSVKKEHITIEGDNAIYKNTWNCLLNFIIN
jgi:preprotein translocase subunit SecA